jgi:hypothetical protein
MRILMIALAAMTAVTVSAQPTFGIGGGSMGCQDVSRQIVRDWFDVRDILSPNGNSARPSIGELQCVSPAALRDEVPRHVGSGALTCYRVRGTGVCCDAQMQQCATR